MSTRTLIFGAGLGLVASSLVACGKSREEGPTPAASAREAEPAGEDGVAATEARGPGLRPDGEVVSAVAWFQGGLEAALKRAAEQDKLVFVEVGAYWCPPCHDMDEQVFTDPALARELGTLAVPVKIDAERGEGPELVERYAVRAYPTMLLLEPSGVEKGRLVDFHAGPDLLAGLRKVAAGGNVLEALEAKAEAAPEDLEAAFAVGHAYALAAQEDEAERWFARVEAADPDNARGFAAKVHYDRALFIIYKRRGDLEGAIEAYRRLQARFPGTPEALRAHRKIGRTLNDLGRADEAIAALDAMIAEDPEQAASYGWFCFRERCHPEKGLAVVRAALARDDEAGTLDAGARGELHYLEAELLRLTGAPEAALTAMRTAAARDPSTAFYRRMVRELEGGG